LEWDLWPNTTYAATGQWAHANLVLHQATLNLPEHDPQWKPRALEALHTITYGQGTQALPADDRMLTTIRELTQPSFGTDTWYEQNFNTVIYLLRCFALAPELVPDDENRMLAQSGGELRSIVYGASSIELDFAAAGTAQLKLVAAPFSVQLDGVWHPMASPGTPGWSWDAASQMLELLHDGAAARLLLDGTTAAEAPALGLRLAQPFPNPANPRVTIAFAMDRAAWVDVSIHDARGRSVRRLWQGQLPSGSQQLVWDGRDDRGRAAASGRYVIRLRAGEQASAQSFVLLK
jgi:hypothetical protein